MSIQVGDYVRRGRSRLTWEVLEAIDSGFDPVWYVLKSGQSGRVVADYFDNLHLHTKKGGTE